MGEQTLQNSHAHSSFSYGVVLLLKRIDDAITFHLLTSPKLHLHPFRYGGLRFQQKKPSGVIEAKAEIHGPRDLYVKMGSLVTLSCKVSQGPHELGTIHWYRGEHVTEKRRSGTDGRPE